MAHLLAPLLFGVGAHGAGKCVPGTPGPGREAEEPDAEPAGGDVGLGSQPPRHKEKLPNHSTIACWHGMVVVRGTTRVRPALLDCLRHRCCCHAGWVRLPTAEGVPRAGGGAPGRREWFPAMGATSAGCTSCGATARVDEGAQRAPHPNGLSVEEGGGSLVGLGRGSHRRRVPTASVSFPHQHDKALPRPGLTAPQTVDDPRTPPRRWWEGDTAVPVCMSRALRACGGFRALGQGTVAHLLSPLGCGPPVSVWGGGMCMPDAPGPNSGAGEPYTKAAGGVCRSGDLRLPPAHN